VKGNHQVVDTGIYRIRRVFHFRNQVKMFDIAPPPSPDCC
jgi:hypothetical protein